MADNNVDFNSILDTKVEEIKARPPIPVGTYDFRIKSLENVISSQKKTPGIEFKVVPFEAGADVDQELLEDSDFLKREIGHTFWITPDSASMIKDFLIDHCGINGSGKTLRQLLAEAVDSTFRGVVTHGTSKAGRPYAEITTTMRIE